MGNCCIKSELSNISVSEFKDNPLNKSIKDDVNNRAVNEEEDDDIKNDIIEVISDELVSKIPSPPSNLEELSNAGCTLMAVFTDSFKLKISLTAPIEMALRCLCGLAIMYSKVLIKPNTNTNFIL
jgi:hypothetical protein